MKVSKYLKLFYNIDIPNATGGAFVYRILIADDEAGIRQLIKKYAKSENFRGEIEDFQLAEDEESRIEAENSLRNTLMEYSNEYLMLYAKDKTDDILKKEITWMEKWIAEMIPLIQKIELDEIAIQTSQIEES